AERELPDLVELVTGMAEGAGVSFWELFCVNAFEELEPLLEPRGGRAAAGGAGGTPGERCSTVTISGPGYTLLGHHEQWLAGALGHVAVVVELPDDGPALVSATLACCLPASGMNEYRVAQGIQSLVAADAGGGTPRALGLPHPPDNAHPAAPPTHSPAPELAARAPPPGQGSQARLARLQELVEERSPATPAAIGEILADHRGGAPQTICEHGTDERAAAR